MTELSAVIPCLNEVDNAAAIAEAVAAQFRAFTEDYELLFIDNGSTDGTVDEIKRLCAADPRIKLIVNNKNYGQLRSPTHAIYQTVGRAVVGIAADFQDPPELIAQFVARWRAGAMIVLGVSPTGEVNFITRIARWLGYAFFARFADYRVIPGATGFGLYDRRVVDTISRWREPEPFFRGSLVESGFPIETVSFHRPERTRGVSKNRIWTLMDFAITGAANSSRRLLRVPIYLAFAMALIGVLMVFAAMVVFATGGSPWPLLAFASMQITFSALFFFLGFLGEQVRLMALTLRELPLVTEKERVNFTDRA